MLELIKRCPEYVCGYAKILDFPIIISDAETNLLYGRVMYGFGKKFKNEQKIGCFFSKNGYTIGEKIRNSYFQFCEGRCLYAG